jgi:hypothetical protein
MFLVSIALTGTISLFVVFGELGIFHVQPGKPVC